MTARDLYEIALIELNKLEAPSLLLEDFNYFVNKAIQQYSNLIWNKFEVDQQSTDDLRVLKTTAELSLTGNAPYTVTLPADYMHLISCIVVYKVSGSGYNCKDTETEVQFAARRMSSDLYTQIINNAYLKPSYRRPYYYISNKNSDTNLPTNKSMDEVVEKAEAPIESTKEAYDRLANVSSVQIGIQIGDGHKGLTPSKLYVDYLKAPMHIRLTQEQINATDDESQILEFPDYVCYEIVNIFTRLIMENFSDPRLQTNTAINQTIASPFQQTSTKN